MPSRSVLVRVVVSAKWCEEEGAPEDPPALVDDEEEEKLDET